MNNPLYGGIEAGGTKFVCCVSDGKGTVTSRAEIATTNVEQTLRAVTNFFNQNSRIVALGVGSFGPVELNPSSEKFGYITNTPKLDWINTDLKKSLENALNVQVIIDTDVNCAAVGEKYFGLAKQCNNFIYLTIGTGIGGSLVLGSDIYRGTSHLEMGHMRIMHEPFNDSFRGTCPSHNDCLEGIASGYAMQKHWGKRAEEIFNPEAWNLEAQYLGTAIANLILTTQPELFILGGGVMKHDDLIDMVREAVQESINGYIELPDLKSYILRSTNPDNAILGAVSLVIPTK